MKEWAAQEEVVLTLINENMNYINELAQRVNELADKLAVVARASVVLGEQLNKLIEEKK